MTQKVPNFNYTPLQNLIPFMHKINYCEKDQKKILDLSDVNIQDYEQTLHELDQNNTGNKLLSLENLRNETLEEFLDPLDNHLNYIIDDWRGELKQFDLDEKEALKRIPEYSAGLTITGTSQRNGPIFLSRYNRTGHVWKEEHIRFLLNRLPLPEVQESLTFLGLTETANKLLAIDSQLIGESREHTLLAQLRKQRHDLLLAFEVILYSTKYKDHISKKRNYILSIEVILDDLKAQQEIAMMSKFSLNDLTFTQCYDLLSGISGNSIQEKWQPFWEKHGIDFVEKYKHCFKELSQIESWDELEQSEVKLFRAAERFLDSLTNHTLCVGICDYPELWEEFEKSPNFQMALDLMEDLAEKGVYIDRLMTRRGSTLCSKEVRRLLTICGGPEYQFKLEQLGLMDLFTEIADADTLSREICRREDIPFSTLEEFRDIRERTHTVYRIVSHNLTT